jgi:hypothetical protein
LIETMIEISPALLQPYGNVQLFSAERFQPLADFDKKGRAVFDSGPSTHPSGFSPAWLCERWALGLLCTRERGSSRGRIIKRAPTRTASNPHDYPAALRQNRSLIAHHTFMARLFAKILLGTAMFIFMFYGTTLLISACCSLDSALLSF